MQIEPKYLNSLIVNLSLLVVGTVQIQENVDYVGEKRQQSDVLVKRKLVVFHEAGLERKAEYIDDYYHRY